MEKFFFSHIQIHKRLGGIPLSVAVRYDTPGKYKQVPSFLEWFIEYQDFKKYQFITFFYMDDISLSIFDIFQPSLLHVLTIGFSANRSSALFMDTSTQIIVHIDVTDSREV